MNKLATLLIASALTALVVGSAMAASTAPTVSRETKTAATYVPGPATAPAPATAVPVPAPATAAPAAAAPVTAAAPKEQQIKIGYVDMSKIAAESEAGKSAAGSIKIKSEKLRAKIEAKQRQLEKEKKAIEAKIETLSPKERAAKAKQFQKKVEEYQKLVRTSEEEMQKMQEKLTSDLYKVIKKTATSYAKAHGYAAIIEEKAVLYAADTLEPKDLTDEIAAELDKKQAK